MSADLLIDDLPAAVHTIHARLGRSRCLRMMRGWLDRSREAPNEAYRPRRNWLAGGIDEPDHGDGRHDALGVRDRGLYLSSAGVADPASALE